MFLTAARCVSESDAELALEHERYLPTAEEVMIGGLYQCFEGLSKCPSCQDQ